MPTASQTAPRHVLRSILRHIRSAPKQSFPNETTTAQTVTPSSSAAATTTTTTTTTTKDPLEKHVLQQYRETAASNNGTRTKESNEALHRMAYHINLLKQDLKERGRLYELDGGAEKKLTPRESSRRAAARAGLKLPDDHKW